jgi:hypothetical protein
MHRRGREVLSQIDAQVPDPLVHDLPAFLTPCGAGTPTISVLFLIFVGQNGFE